MKSKTSALLRIYDRLYAFYGPQGWWPAKTRWEVIIGAILTQNTAWANVEKAVKNLRRARKLSSPGAIHVLEKSRLARLIRPAGYYNIKAHRLKNFTSFLFSRYGGRLTGLSRRKTRDLREELLSINGVGPETCDSILLYALKRPLFVIDAYTERVFSRHGLVEPGADYHEIQKIFMDNLPADHRLYNEYHALIVRLAKDFCRTKPRCSSCPLHLA